MERQKSGSPHPMPSRYLSLPHQSVLRLLGLLRASLCCLTLSVLIYCLKMSISCLLKLELNSLTLFIIIMFQFSLFMVFFRFQELEVNF